MIIELTGEQLQIENESLLDDPFMVELDESFLQSERAIITAASHHKFGDMLADIDVVYANQSAQIALLEMKEQASLEREAMEKEVDL